MRCHEQATLALQMLYSLLVISPNKPGLLARSLTCSKYCSNHNLDQNQTRNSEVACKRTFLLLGFRILPHNERCESTYKSNQLVCCCCYCANVLVLCVWCVLVYIGRPIVSSSKRHRVG